MHEQQAPKHMLCPLHQPELGTPQVPFQTLSQNSGPHYLNYLLLHSQKTDRYSTSTDDDQEVCDAEVNNITRMPSQATSKVMTPQRPTSTPATVDYSTQGDPDQVPQPVDNKYIPPNSTTARQNTNNFLISDSSDTCIHDLHNKAFHVGILDTMHI